MIYWAAAGFGYRPIRVVGSSLVVVVAYGVLFWATGGVVASAGSPHPAEFWECLYFSGITFATIGYGDFVPAPHMRLLALTEGACGSVYDGLFRGGTGQQASARNIFVGCAHSTEFL